MKSRPLTALTLALASAVGLTGCVLGSGSTPEPGESTIDVQVEQFESNPLVAVQFTLTKPVQNFDDSTYVVEDSEALGQLEAALTEHSEHGVPFDDADGYPTGGTTADITVTHADGTAQTLLVRNYEGDTQQAIVELLEGWHVELPELYAGDDAIIGATVSSSRTPDEVQVSDAARLDELASVMREHGIFTDYASPLPETPPTLGTAIYDVTVVLTDGSEVTLRLDPAAVDAAAFSTEARALVEDWS